MSPEESFKDLLRERDQMVTAPRLLLFRALARKSPLTTVKLTLLMEKNGINRATSYRNLLLLRQLGVIRDIIVHGTRLIELSEDFAHHHHHFWCTSCGRLSDFDNPDLDQALEAVASRMGIEVTSHQLEMSGLCATCLAGRSKL